MDDEDPEFQRHWAAWQANNRIEEKELRRKQKVVFPLVILLAAAAYACCVFWRIMP
jgi:hypothetical protein